MFIVDKPETEFPPVATRENCLKFMGILFDAEWMRRLAANPECIASVAAQSSATESFVLAKMLAFADGIDALAAEGLTPPTAGASLDGAPNTLSSSSSAPPPHRKGKARDRSRRRDA